jgi:hypothetical protein
VFCFPNQEGEFDVGNAIYLGLFQSLDFIIVAELNGDGFDDLIISYGHNISYSFNTGTYAGITEFQYLYSHGTYENICVADIDGDGDNDIMVPQTWGRIDFLRHSDGQGTFVYDYTLNAPQASPAVETHGHWSYIGFAGSQ